MNAILNLKKHIGEFWWYSLLIFIAARSGDVIQAFIGLWLVPHYVPQEELGAVLPLVQISTSLCIPLAILLTPFMKFLNTYSTRREYGKVKRLLQVAFVGALVIFVLMFVATRWIMPMLFERMRIPEGMLGILIVCTGLISTTSPIFQNALQALKKFNAIFVINALGAPARLFVLLATMPIRALSGYMLGQMTPGIVSIGGAILGLRKELGKDVKARPFLREDWKPMLRYTWPIAVNTIIGAVLVAWQFLLIRQRLPAIESAAYYMISRLAEIGCYVGLSLSVVMFPLAAEAEVKGKSRPHLLRNLLGATAFAGAAFVILYAIAGRFILGLVPLWREYIVYAPELVLLTAVMAMRMVAQNFANYEMAQSRFKFLLWMLPMGIVETVPLVALTGYGFFYGILPDSFVGWMASLNAGRLEFFLWWFFLGAVMEVFCVCVQLFLRKRTSREVL